MTGPTRATDRWKTLQVGLKSLLADAELHAPMPALLPHAEPELRPLGGGRNNAVFRVDWAGRPLLLKQYFSDPRDPTDRLGAEAAFLGFAWQQGIRAVPRLLAVSPRQGMALLEFIQGHRIEASGVSESHVEQAAEFCRRLLAARTEPAAQALPVAAEACFSIQEHLTRVEKRIQRLRQIRSDSTLHAEALRFIQDDVFPRWRAIHKSVLDDCRALKLSAEQLLDADQRCVSPSDFGFHNALVAADGRLRFFDFEYAGWDDPAKWVGDFFSQVEVPVPRRFFQGFAERIASAFTRPEIVVARIRLLLPLYRLKWCCIVLNEFLPVGWARREFAGADGPDRGRLERQLQKARRILETLGPT